MKTTRGTLFQNKVSMLVIQYKFVGRLQEWSPFQGPCRSAFYIDLVAIFTLFFDLELLLQTNELE